MAGPYAVREKLVPRASKAPLRLRTYFYRDMDALAQGYLDDSARYTPDTLESPDRLDAEVWGFTELFGVSVSIAGPFMVNV